MSKKLDLVKRPDFLLEGSLDDDKKIIERIGVGEVISIGFSKVRDPLNHRRYFAMITIGFENQIFYGNKRVYRKAMEMRAGYWIEVQLQIGDQIVKRKWPDSIAYERLAEPEFTELKKSVGDEICKDLNMQYGDLQEEIDQVIKLAYINPEPEFTNYIDDNKKAEVRNDTKN